MDLIDLDGSVHHHGQIGNANTNDLNSVLHPQGVPNQYEHVQEAKDEEREEGRDRTEGCALDRFVADLVTFDTILKPCKYISIKTRRIAPGQFLQVTIVFGRDLVVQSRR